MKEKLKKKKGIARLFEIAGERKGLLILAGILSVTLIFICGCFSFISLKYSFTSDVERSVKFSLKFSSEEPCAWKNSNTNNLRCFCINVMYSSITYRRYSVEYISMISAP